MYIPFFIFLKWINIPDHEQHGSVSSLPCVSVASIGGIFPHSLRRHHTPSFCIKDSFPWKLPPEPRWLLPPRTTPGTSRPHRPLSPWQTFPSALPSFSQITESQRWWQHLEIQKKTVVKRCSSILATIPLY